MKNFSKENSNKCSSIVLSGAQPTGNLTIGNYLGAIKSWVKMQEDHSCLFCIVDLHAITVSQNPETLLNNITSVFALYLACGLNPKQSIIFQQSTVPEHSELAWILSCITSIGWLNRMTQFKEKAKNKEESASLGLYSYPVLMAADILLYHATHVPVGIDQKQHIELTRDIAGSFNRHYNQNYFTLPNPIIDLNVQKIMSLRNADKKMSKSDPLDASRINMNDNPGVIADKIRRAKTDPISGIWYDKEQRPEISNLLSIYSAITDQTIEESQVQVKNLQTGSFKTLLSDVLIEKLIPIHKLSQEILKDKAYLNEIKKLGTIKAREIASKTMDDVKRICGLG